MKSYLRSRVCCEVIKELYCFIHGSFGALCFFTCKGAEGWQYGIVNCSAVVQADSNNFLDEIDLLIIQFGCVVWCNGVLCCGTIYLLGCPVGAMLRCFWHFVTETLSQLAHISVHQHVQPFVLVVPFQIYTSI